MSTKRCINIGRLFVLLGCYSIAETTTIHEASAQTRRPECFGEIVDWRQIHKGKVLVIGVQIKIDGEDGVPRDLFVKFGGQVLRDNGYSSDGRLVSLDLIQRTTVPGGTDTAVVLFKETDVLQVLSLAPGKVSCYVQ